MSRLAKKPIAIPEGVVVELKDGVLRVRGPKGELVRKTPSEINLEQTPEGVFVRSRGESKSTSALLGTYSRHLKNMIEGVLNGFEKKLEIEGIGFKAEIKGRDLFLSIGFSHQVIIPPREGVFFAVEKNAITVSGIDKEAVGNATAQIRDKKKPEPYKGKGIRYSGEVIRRKAGKKVAASA